MFDIVNTLSFNKDRLTVGHEYDYVTRTSLNQGILQGTGFVNKTNLNEENVWSLGLLQMDFFYRKRKWYAGQFVRKIIPKFDTTANNIKFFSTMLNKLKPVLLQVLIRNVDDTFKNQLLNLPTKNGKIDFEFMETFVAELEAQRVAELKNYLEVSGLDNYELSNKELEVLESYNSVEWGKYRIGDLFDSYNGNFDIQKKHINDMGEYVITAGVSNNGILGKSDIEAKVFKSKTITVDMFGYAFYRSFNYKMVTHARVFSLTPKNKITENQGIFLESSLSYLKKLFGYENMCSFAKIKNLTTILPTKNGKIDFDFMETYISAITKLAIKDVVKYADKRIDATKKIVNKQ